MGLLVPGIPSWACLVILPESILLTWLFQYRRRSLPHLTVLSLSFFSNGSVPLPINQRVFRYGSQYLNFRRSYDGLCSFVVRSSFTGR